MEGKIYFLCENFYTKREKVFHFSRDANKWFAAEMIRMLIWKKMP